MKTQYSFNLEQFCSPEKYERIKKFSRDKKTPFLLVDLDVIEQKYKELKTHMPTVNVYYAVKANPMDEVIVLLRDLGSNFDVATVYELDQLLRLGVHPNRMSYGNTIKKIENIQYAYEKGVRIFATDSEEDLKKISKYAPGSKVFFRILTSGTGADWPLSRKFGSHPDLTYTLILEAKKLGLVPYGLSFHVGSQQRDIGQWDDAIAQCDYLFDSVKPKGIDLQMINLGGGFPATYIQPTQPVEIYANEITRFLKEDFSDGMPELFIEPGRSMTADAGVMISEIIMISKKARYDAHKWVYVDVGVFGGMIETLNESLKYPIYFDRKGDEEEIILAGPTCDSMDIMYEKFKYKMPHTSQPGDKIMIFTTGAYTQSYCSIYFNGFPPLRSYILR